MSTLAPSFAYGKILAFRKEHKVASRLKIRAQRFKDEGRSSNLVDSNMKLLKYRIEVMRTKERLERNHRPYGWDYAANYMHNPKNHPQLHTISLICGTMSFSILICTTLLCIFAVIVHLIL